MPRPRRGAYYYKRPGRRGWYAYLDRDHKDISLETEDENEAAAGLAKLLDGRRLRDAAPNDQKIAACFAELLLRSRTNNTKKTTYEVGLNARRVLAWLESRGVTLARDVDRDLVEDYKEARRFQPSRADKKKERKVSAARINRELDTWKQGMKIGIEWGACSPTVLDAFVKLREPRPQPHQIGLTKAQLAAFLKAEKHPTYRALFRTAIGTGMRDDELRHMESTDVQPPWIVVTPKAGWTTKGYRYRSIPVSKATVKAARAFIAGKAKLNLDPKAIWKRLQAARVAAKIPLHFSMHDLRRAWASHMLAAGHRIEDISKWLGHADIMTTMRYLRVVTTAVPDQSSLPF